LTAAFSTTTERDFAALLDFYHVRWLYEPHLFVLELREDGKIRAGFQPDFYLPDQDLYIEVTTMRQKLVTRKNQKVRKLRYLHPSVRVEVWYREDLHDLGVTA
jgi:hypoxanthine phosphoribosyltransferase